MTYRKIILLFVILPACSKTKDTRLFELISNEKSNINFNNTLDYTENLNPYTYRNFYNGGGVAIGDFNNDSLQDIFFTGNLVSNKLYLNKETSLSKILPSNQDLSQKVFGALV